MNCSELDSRLNEMIGETETGVLGLGVIVFKDGSEVFSKFLGRRKINPDLPVTRDTRFRVASISKMFRNPISRDWIIGSEFLDGVSHEFF